MKSVNLGEKLAKFSTHWDPHVIADYNDNEVMVVKFKGEFPVHKHDNTDDFYTPRSGIKTGTSLEIAGLGGDSQYLKSSSYFKMSVLSCFIVLKQGRISVPQ